MTEQGGMDATPSHAATPAPHQATNAPRSQAEGPPRPRAGGLAQRQADLVAALTSGAPTPPGFDAERVQIAARALLRKRAAGVAAAWPWLASGEPWPAAFVEWAAGRPPRGALQDGWDFARWLQFRNQLPATAAVELACREASLAYDGSSPPRPRRLPAVRRVGGAVAASVWGRIILLRAPRPKHHGGSGEGGSGG
ncbi:MAG: hypothetical protein ACRDT8_24090 [Micromonosporaceae bacterium]